SGRTPSRRSSSALLAGTPAHGCHAAARAMTGWAASPATAVRTAQRAARGTPTTRAVPATATAANVIPDQMSRRVKAGMDVTGRPALQERGVRDAGDERFGVCERYATVVAARDDQRGLADRGRQVGAGPQVVEEARPERIDPSSARDVSRSAVVSAATTRRVG